MRSARWMRNEQVHGSIRSSCPLFRHCRAVYLLVLLCSKDKPLQLTRSACSNTHFGSVATGVQHHAKARPHGSAPVPAGWGSRPRAHGPGARPSRWRADRSAAAALPPPSPAAAAGGRMRSRGAQRLFALGSRCPPPTGGLVTGHRLGADRLRGSERGALPFRPSVPAARAGARCCTTRFLFLSLRCAAGSGGECAGRRSPPWVGGTTRPVPPARSPPNAALARPRRVRGSERGGAPPVPAPRPTGPALSEGKEAESSPGRGGWRRDRASRGRHRSPAGPCPFPRRPGRAWTPAPRRQSRGGAASRYRRPSPRCPRRGGSRCPGAAARGSAAGAGSGPGPAGPAGGRRRRARRARGRREPERPKSREGRGGRRGGRGEAGGRAAGACALAGRAILE